MSYLSWSPRAIADLSRLRNFLLSKDAEAAARAIKIIREGVEVLKRHPEIGRLIEDLPSQYREGSIRFGSGGYVVRYRLEGKKIIVLAVRHSRERAQ